MIYVLFVLASVGQDNARSVDARTVAEVFRSYNTSFKDVQFIYEGTIRRSGSKEGDASTFQGSYAYRNDGATLIDVFGLPRGGKPGSRLLSSVLGERLENLNAQPDIFPRLRDRQPEVARGGSGSLNRTDSPERIFLAWFLGSHADAEEYGLEPQGWEEVNGRRCLVVHVDSSPRRFTRGRNMGTSFKKLWIDLERGGIPLRIEYHDDGHVGIRTEILDVQRVSLPGGRDMWFPARGRTETFGAVIDKGKVSFRTEPDIETHNILTSGLKFDRGLTDGYFSVKKHALVTSDEGLRKLQRELENTKPVPRPKISTDPESLKKRLDDALAEADKQSKQLEASSAARGGGGWSAALPWGLGVFGVILLVAAVVRLRRGA